MELADLKRFALAAREFSLAVGDPARHPACHVSLRIPTQHEVDVAARRSVVGAGDDQAAHVVLSRSLLLLGVVGWSGVTVGDVLPDSAEAADVLPYEPGAVELLLDAQPEWAQAMYTALIDRMVKRKEAKDTAAKN